MSGNRNDFPIDLKNDVKGNSGVGKENKPTPIYDSDDEDDEDDEYDIFGSSEVDKSFKKKDRYKDEPSFPFSRNNILEDDGSDNQSLEELGNEIADSVKDKSGDSIFSKILMILAGSLLLKKLLSSDFVQNLLNKFFPGRNKEVESGTKEKIPKGNPILTLIASILGLIAIIFVVMMSYYYLLRVGRTDGGLVDGLKKIRDGRAYDDVKNMDGDFIEESVLIKPFKRISDTEIQITLSEDKVLNLDYKTDKESGEIQLKIIENKTRGQTYYEIIE